MTIEELKAQYIEATNVLDAINTEQRSAIFAATQAVKETFKERLTIASVNAANANRQLLVAQAEAIELKAKTCPLVGKRVTAVRKRKNSPWSRDMEDVIGVIEVITERSDQPGGDRNRYKRLKHGTIAVRHLNEAGKPLKTVEPLVTRDDKRAAMEANSYYADLSPDQKEKMLSYHWVFVD